MSRDVTWGLYIAQFTFLVGVAASAVMVVLPYYLHDYKAFGRITILGEFLAISAVTMCMLFIFVDMGQPARVLNVLLYPTPNSMMFWDMVVAHRLPAAERRHRPGHARAPSARAWRRPGGSSRSSSSPSPGPSASTPSRRSSTPACPGGSFWLTAILAPRFLASAFASGPGAADPAVPAPAAADRIRRRRPRPSGSWR